MADNLIPCEGIKIKPIKGVGKTKKNFLGSKLWEHEFPNVAIVARKGSGKSTLIANLLNELDGPNTLITMFAGTHDFDPVYKAVKEKHEPIIYDDIGGGAHIAEMIKGIKDYNEMTEALKQAKKEGRPEVRKFILTENDIPDDDKIRIPQKLTYVNVFDDLDADELSTNELYTLCKKNRHWRTINLISSQAIVDVKPRARKNINVYILFAGIDDANLKRVYNDAKLDVSFEEFKRMYDIATDEKFNFLVVDCFNCIYKKNFTQVFGKT
jgi:hypothetical protein